MRIVCRHALPSGPSPANLRRRVLEAERDGTVGAFNRLMRIKFFGLRMRDCQGREHWGASTTEDLHLESPVPLPLGR